jgi:hypothetical protein
MCLEIFWNCQETTEYNLESGLRRWDGGRNLYYFLVDTSVYFRFLPMSYILIAGSYLTI